MLGCWCNVWVLMQCSGVDAMFWCWCNDQVLMQCSGVDAMFGCLCNVRVLMQCSGVNAMFGCWCNVWVLMQCLSVNVLHKIVISVNPDESSLTYNSYHNFDAILRFLVYHLKSIDRDWEIVQIFMFVSVNSVLISSPLLI